MIDVGTEDHTGYAGTLSDSSVRSIVAGDFEAVFLPGRGMIGASLRHRGEEILRRTEDLETMAVREAPPGSLFFIRGRTASRVSAIAPQAGRYLLIRRPRSCTWTITASRYTVCRGRVSPGR